MSLSLVLSSTRRFVLGFYYRSIWNYSQSVTMTFLERAIWLWRPVKRHSTSRTNIREATLVIVLPEPHCFRGGHLMPVSLTAFLFGSTTASDPTAKCNSVERRRRQFYLLWFMIDDRSQQDDNSDQPLLVFERLARPLGVMTYSQTIFALYRSSWSRVGKQLPISCSDFNITSKSSNSKLETHLVCAPPYDIVQRSVFKST